MLFLRGEKYARIYPSRWYIKRRREENPQESTLLVDSSNKEKEENPQENLIIEEKRKKLIGYEEKLDRIDNADLYERGFYLYCIEKEALYETYMWTSFKDYMRCKWPHKAGDFFILFPFQLSFNTNFR